MKAFFWLVKLLENVTLVLMVETLLEASTKNLYRLWSNYYVDVK